MQDLSPPSPQLCPRPVASGRLAPHRLTIQQRCSGAATAAYRQSDRQCTLVGAPPPIPLSDLTPPWTYGEGASWPAVTPAQDGVVAAGSCRCRCAWTMGVAEGDPWTPQPTLPGHSLYPGSGAEWEMWRRRRRGDQAVGLGRDGQQARRHVEVHWRAWPRAGRQQKASAQVTDSTMRG